MGDRFDELQRRFRLDQVDADRMREAEQRTARDAELEAETQRLLRQMAAMGITATAEDCRRLAAERLGRPKA